MNATRMMPEWEKGNFKPAMQNYTYIKYWEFYLPDVKSSKTFRVSHLVLLDILCRMHIRLKAVEEILEVAGDGAIISDLKIGKNKKRESFAHEAYTRYAQEIKNLSGALGLTAVRQYVSADSKMAETFKERGPEWE